MFRGIHIHKHWHGRAEILTEDGDFFFQRVPVGQIPLPYFVPIRKQNTVNIRPVFLHKRGLHLLDVKARHERQLGIYSVRIFHHRPDVFARENFRVIGKIINAPCNQIRFFQTQLCQLDGPAMKIQLKRFGERRFARGHERHPNFDVIRSC